MEPEKAVIPEGPGKVKTEYEGTLTDAHANHFHLLGRNGKSQLFDVQFLGLPMNELKKFIGRRVRVKTKVEFLD